MVIGHFFVYPLGITAEKAGRPYISVSLSSATIPSKHIPPPGFPNLGKGMNFFLWKLAEIFMGRILLPAINRRRMQEKLRPAEKNIRRRYGIQHVKPHSREFFSLSAPA